MDRLDAVFTDVLLHMVVANADVLDGYNWDPEALEDALEREIGVISAAQRLFVPTFWAANWIAAHMPVAIADKTRVVGWGPGISIPALSTPESATESIRLLFVGNDGQRKGLSQLLMAFSELRREFPAAELTVVGDIKPSEVEGVRWLGHLSWRDELESARLRAEYGAADIFVVPSLFEPVGCVYIEAMLAGLPVVAYEIGPVSEVIGPDAGWLSSPNQLSDLVAALRSAAKSRGDRLRRGSLGRARAEARYSWGLVARRVVEEMASCHS